MRPGEIISSTIAMIIMVFIVLMIVMHTLSSQRGCSPCPKEKEKEIKDPVWLKTNYFRDPNGLCFACVKDLNQVGLTFIPEHRCPIEEDKHGPFNSESSVP